MAHDVIWVVEMWREETQRYEPTTATGVCKADAIAQRRDWKANCPSFKFRVAKYRREGGGGKNGD